MSSKSSAIGKGILIGAAAGVALYVIWRRSRERHEVYQAPVQAPERQAPDAVVTPAPEPAQEAAFAPAAAAEPEPEPAVETEPVAEPGPVAGPEPAEEPQPVAAEKPAPVAARPAAPVSHPPPAPVAEHGARRQPLTYTGRPRDLSPAGWPQPMPLGTTSGGMRRPAPVSARATWPGVAGAGQLRPTPLRRAAPRGGSGPLHRAG